MALPTAAVITKKIILPANLREAEMEVQVESEANQYIPFALGRGQSRLPGDRAGAIEPR